MYEYKVEIDGVTYGMSELVSCSLQQVMLDAFAVGNACSAELEVTLLMDSVPQGMLEVKPYVKRTTASSNDWHRLGTFYVDTVEYTNGLTRLTCYDGMLKADEQFFQGGDTGEWPRTQAAVAQQIAQRIGLPLDSRTQLSTTYEVPYPNEDTMRTILGNIAASHGGNWIVTADSKLLLVPLFSSMPTETSLLVTEDGDYISLGGVRLLV